MLTVIKGQNVNQTLAIKALLRPSMGQSNKNLRHHIPFLLRQEKKLNRRKIRPRVHQLTIISRKPNICKICAIDITSHHSLETIF